MNNVYKLMVMSILGSTGLMYSMQEPGLALSLKNIYEKIERENAQDPVRHFLSQGRVHFAEDNC